MKKIFGLLVGATMMASIPVMADEQILRDSELDAVTAGGSALAAALASGAATVTGDYQLDVADGSGSAQITANITPSGPTSVTLLAAGSSN